MSTFVVVKQCILQALLFLRQVHKILMSLFFCFTHSKGPICLAFVAFVCFSFFNFFIIYLFIYLQVFSGNTDRSTVVPHVLNPPIIAPYIRFLPATWHNHISMRVELYGCPGNQSPLEKRAEMFRFCCLGIGAINAPTRFFAQLFSTVPEPGTF